MESGGISTWKGKSGFGRGCPGRVGGIQEISGSVTAWIWDLFSLGFHAGPAASLIFLGIWNQSAIPGAGRMPRKREIHGKPGGPGAAHGVNSWGKQILALGSADVGGSGFPLSCALMFSPPAPPFISCYFWDQNKTSSCRVWSVEQPQLTSFVQCKRREGFPAVIHHSSPIPSVGKSPECCNSHKMSGWSINNWN